jgi:hypothetical protein
MITRSKIIRTILLSAMILGLAVSLSAQFTINIPNIPKFGKKKDKTQPTAPTGQDSGMQTSSARSEETSSSPSNSCESYYIYFDDIAKVKKEAESFTPGREYYVSTLSDGKNKYFEAALSPSTRQKWFGGMTPEFVKCLGPALNDLAAVARKTLPTYTGPVNYTFGTLAEKKTLQSAIKDIADARVLKVGILEPNWSIAKDSYNFPTARYKHGVIVAKYPNADHGYCWLFWVNLVQDYAGGGTYGASYGNYIARAISGCPAGN